MNFDKFTIKAQEAIQNAINIAKENSNQAIENGHLLRAILNEDEKLITYLFNKSGGNIDNLQLVIDSIIRSYPKVSGTNEYLSNEANRTIREAEKAAKSLGDEFITIEHLLIGILKSGGDISKLLNDNGITVRNLEEAIKSLRNGSTANSQTAEDTYRALDKYAINLNERAESGKLDPVIGRDEEIRRILQILSRRTKNNPILIGEPGVGKTAIAEGIAHRIISGDVPENLKDKKILSLDMGALIAGAKYKGEFEERLKSVVKEVIASDGQIVLFIDEIHTLVGAGRGDGAMDAANILKPALARGELRAIGATTLNEYQKYFENDKALERRFQQVMVHEPDIEDSISILRGLKDKYEFHHQVRIKDDAIISAVELSDRYITERFLPDKAIDLIDEASAKLKLEINSVPEEVDEISRRIKQLEIEREAIKREGDKNKLFNLSQQIENLQEQEKSLRAKWKLEKEVIDIIQNSKNKIEEYKYNAEQAERNGEYNKVAELRYGKIKEEESKIEQAKIKLKEIQGENAMIKEEVDSEDIAIIVSKWTGIPVSKMIQSEREKLLNLENELHKRVVGQDLAVQTVSDAIRRNRAGIGDNKRPIGSFIFLGTTGVGKTELAKALAEYLFDDENMMTRIDMSEYQEKHSVSRLIGAPPGYVGYDEGGQLTEAVRRKPYSVILLDEIEKAHPDVFNVLLQVLEDGRLTDNKGRTVNFKNSMVIMTSNIGSDIIQNNLNNETNILDQNIIESTENKLNEILRQYMRPEFLNRIDEIIMFKPLTKDQIIDIVELQFDLLRNKLLQQGVEIRISQKALDWLSKISFDPQFGARPVKRAIQRNILNELSREIISNNISQGSAILIDFKDDRLVFENV